MFVAFAYVNLKRLLELLKDALEPKPYLIPRARERVKEVFEFAKESFPDSAESMERIVGKVMGFLDELESRNSSKERQEQHYN